ncbi:MAG: MoaD/ThiS family protein [Actinobacteria bacterium]|nr:MoaD/ThiS family protein [Actinomycetota bacterium]
MGDVLAAARAAYGADFTAVLENARVWVNGDEPTEGDATVLRDGDEVAVIPPVSGGSN